MKVVAFVGSPRTDGATDALVRQVLNGAEDKGADTAIFHIGVLNISGCKACMACKKSGVCIQKDDMQELYDEIRFADAIILGTPIYIYYMTAQMKAFTDRLFCFIGYNFEKRLDEKKTVFVVTQGAENPELFSAQIENMKKAWSMVNFSVVETIIATGTHKRDQITDNEDLMERAFIAGQNLVD